MFLIFINKQWFTYLFICSNLLHWMWKLTHFSFKGNQILYKIKKKILLLNETMSFQNKLNNDVNII